MHDDALSSLIARADLDGLIRLVDDHTSSREWDELWRLRQKCRAALETGRQLWPAATLADYRIALLAPAEVACRALLAEPGRFSIGPLTEVVAQNHTWAQLNQFLTDDLPIAAYVAQERVLRGEQLDGDPLAEATTAYLGLPLGLEPWEPSEPPLPVYRDASFLAEAPDHLHVKSPPLELPESVGSEFESDDDVEQAVRGLVQPWLTESNGVIELAVADGGYPDALTALGHTSVRCDDVTPEDLIASLMWVGASGGAHGRRRGGAAGRWNAWWCAKACCGFELDDDVPGDELGETLDELLWWHWTPQVAMTGWELGVAFTDLSENRSWAWRVHDHADAEQPG